MIKSFGDGETERLWKKERTRLGKYFGMTPQFWMNLQTDYDLRIAATTAPLNKIKTRKAAWRQGVGPG